MTQHGRKANGTNMPRETGTVSGCSRNQTWLPTNKSTQGTQRHPRIPLTKEPERVTVARIKPRPSRPASREPQHQAGTTRVDGGNRSGPQDRMRGLDRGRRRPQAQMHMQGAAHGPNHLNLRQRRGGPHHRRGGRAAVQRTPTPPVQTSTPKWREGASSYQLGTQRRSSKMRTLHTGTNEQGTARGPLSDICET